MDIHDSQRIKEIRDNTAKVADAFTRIADALERLADRKTEPSRGYMWTCQKCGTENHSDFKKCPCCGYTPQTDCVEDDKCFDCEDFFTCDEHQADCPWK